ncbi:hypothetical protein [Pseudomonas aeruginosa]
MGKLGGRGRGILPNQKVFFRVSLATQAGEATAPIAEAIGSGFSRIVTEFMAGTDGMAGDAARKSLKMQDKREREANRGVRKTMKECIKPGNVIDDDVKECLEGLRVKTW